MSSKYTTIKSDTPSVKWYTTVPVDNVRTYPRNKNVTNKQRKGSK